MERLRYIYQISIILKRLTKALQAIKTYNLGVFKNMVTLNKALVKVQAAKLQLKCLNNSSLMRVINNYRRRI